MFKVERINVESQPAVAVKEQIRVVPTLRLLHDGGEVRKRNGTWTVPELEQRIKTETYSLY